MSPSILIKSDAHESCVQVLQDRLHALQTELDALKTALGSESKSSAGDKHETGRAMIQLEQERLGGQYTASRKQLELLQRLSIAPCNHIVLGALARINEEWYYFATGLGTVDVKAHKIIVLGLTSPLAQALKGMMVGSSTQFRDQLFRVQEIY